MLSQNSFAQSHSLHFKCANIIAYCDRVPGQNALTDICKQISYIISTEFDTNWNSTDNENELMQVNHIVYMI